jgi:hypothetical protein
MTGFSKFAFNALKISTYGDRGNGGRRVGRPSSLNSDGELGLYLLYVGSMMNIKHICLVFGVVLTTANISIRKAMDLICRKLRNHPAARAVFPDKDEMENFAELVQIKEPMRICRWTDCSGSMLR